MLGSYSSNSPSLGSSSSFTNADRINRARFKSRLHLRGWLRSTPAGRRPQIRSCRAGGLAGCRQLDPSHPVVLTCEDAKVEPCHKPTCVFTSMARGHRSRARNFQWSTIHYRLRSTCVLEKGVATDSACSRCLRWLPVAPSCCGLRAHYGRASTRRLPRPAGSGER